MQVFALTMGTRGDFELFVMLGIELSRRGHKVTIGSSPFYEAGATEAGLGFAPIGPGTRDELVGIMRGLPELPGKRERVAAYYDRWVRPQMRASLDEIKLNAGRSHYFINNMRSIWMRGGKVIPGANIIYDPPSKNLDQAGPSMTKQTGAILDVVAMNQLLIDPEEHWGKDYHFTGFWQRRGGSNIPIPDGLEAFLAAGPAPVVITMGSMVMFDSQRLAREMAQGLERAGQRGVLVGAWSGISRADGLPGEVFCVEEAPYDWLFPRASCVIHHGGCGTVAAVLRAGCPSILMPQISSQENFAELMTAENLVAGVLPVEGLEADQVAACVRRAASDETLRQSALAWQSVIEQDPGVEAAVEMIEAHAKVIYRPKVK